MTDIPSNETVTPQPATTKTLFDYTPGYSISIESGKVLEGARIISEAPALSSNLVDSFYGHINVDPDDSELVVGLYNKYKSAWEAEKGTGFAFVYSHANALELMSVIKIHLFLDNLEGSNVYYDATTSEYVVVPKNVESDSLETSLYATDIYSTERYPNALSSSQQIHRDLTGSPRPADSNYNPHYGFILRNSEDLTSIYDDFDVADAVATQAAYNKHRGFWYRDNPTTNFTYSLENAVKLKRSINIRAGTFSALTPFSGRTLRERLNYEVNVGATHVNPILAGEGVIVSSKYLDREEYKVAAFGPVSELGSDGETLTGWYDFGSPYHSGKNRF